MSLGTFLNGRDATHLRGAAFLSLSDTGHRLMGTFTDDGGGGGTHTFSAGSTIPCAIAPITGAESEAASGISDRSTHLLQTPPGTVLTLGDRFEVDDRGTFTITAIRERTADWTTQFEAVEI